MEVIVNVQQRGISLVILRKLKKKQKCKVENVPLLIPLISTTESPLCVAVIEAKQIVVNCNGRECKN